MEELKMFLDRYLTWVLEKNFDPRQGFDQAYGGLQLYIELFPAEEEEAEDLWHEEYYPKFLEAVFKSNT
jgi:hypothetical protein